MQQHPRPGIKPMSPALAGGFFTAEPPGKLPAGFLFLFFFLGYFSSEICGSLKYFKSFQLDWVECVWVGGVPIHRGTSGQNLQEL